MIQSPTGYEANAASRDLDICTPMVVVAYIPPGNLVGDQSGRVR